MRTEPRDRPVVGSENILKRTGTPLMARENTEHLTIRMPASQVARLDALAEKMGLTRSQLLRRLVVAPLRT